MINKNLRFLKYTGDYYEGEIWSTFDELYDEYYSEYARMFEKPLMITEFGSSISGGDKVEWVRDMFKSLEKYPRIKVAIWWSHIDYDANGNEATKSISFSVANKTEPKKVKDNVVGIVLIVVSVVILGGVILFFALAGKKNKPRRKTTVKTENKD